MQHNHKEGAMPKTQSGKRTQSTRSHSRNKNGTEPVNRMKKVNETPSWDQPESGTRREEPEMEKRARNMEDEDTLDI
jgi:hypothetical protein